MNQDNKNIKSGNLGNTVKNLNDKATSDQPMTGEQNSYLHTLASEANEEIPEALTKAEASEKIEELQEKTGRGLTDNPYEKKADE